MNVCIFCSFITQISVFVIPEICLTASVIHFKVKVNYKHRLCGDFRTPEAEHLTLQVIYSSFVLKFEHLHIV